MVFHRAKQAADSAAIKHDLRQLRDDLNHMLGTVNEYARSKFRESNMRNRSRFTDMKDRTYDRLSGAYEDARDYGASALSQGRHQVEQHPLSTVLGALAVGMILGWLFHRR